MVLALLDESGLHLPEDAVESIINEVFKEEKPSIFGYLFIYIKIVYAFSHSFHYSCILRLTFYSDF